MIGTTRCPKCRTLRPCACVVERRDHERTTTERGYDWAWRQCRASVLAERPLCEDCRTSGIVTPACEVHHVVKIKDDPSLRLDAANLMALCSECHQARTARGE